MFEWSRTGWTATVAARPSRKSRPCARSPRRSLLRLRTAGRGAVAARSMAGAEARRRSRLVRQAAPVEDRGDRLASGSGGRPPVPQARRAAVAGALGQGVLPGPGREAWLTQDLRVLNPTSLRRGTQSMRGRASAVFASSAARRQETQRLHRGLLRRRVGVAGEETVQALAAQAPAIRGAAHRQLSLTPSRGHCL